MSADFKYGLKKCLRLLYQKLWAFYVLKFIKFTKLRPIFHCENSSKINMQKFTEGVSAPLKVPKVSRKFNHENRVLSIIPSEILKIQRNLQNICSGQKNGFWLQKLKKYLTSKNGLQLALSPVVFEIWAIL